MGRWVGRGTDGWTDRPTGGRLKERLLPPPPSLGAAAAACTRIDAAALPPPPPLPPPSPLLLLLSLLLLLRRASSQFFLFFSSFFARALNTILTLKPLVGVGHQVGGATARVVTSSSLIDSLFMVTMGPTAWLPSSFPLAFFGSCLSFFFLRRRAGKQQQQQQLTD